MAYIHRQEQGVVVGSEAGHNDDESFWLALTIEDGHKLTDLTLLLSPGQMAQLRAYLTEAVGG